MPDFEGRKIAFSALVGSHNYNLNDATSDKDYKYFVLPTFEDLYDNKYYSMPSQISEELDYDVHDVRRVPNLFYKANINFLEVLYSKEIALGGVALIGRNYKYIPKQLYEIFSMRDDISKMNIPYLFHACKGMHFNKMQYLNKGTKGTMPLVKKFGYDTKQALHAYRVLDFLERFYYNEFNFKKAMTYTDEQKAFPLSIKYGYFSEVDFRKTIDDKLQKVLTLQSAYDKMSTDEKTYQVLKDLIKELVREDLNY